MTLLFHVTKQRLLSSVNRKESHIIQDLLLRLFLYTLPQSVTWPSPNMGILCRHEHQCRPSDACASTLRYFIHNICTFVMSGKCNKAFYQTAESFLKSFRVRFSIMNHGCITHKACRNETPKEEVVPVHILKAYVYVAWKYSSVHS